MKTPKELHVEERIRALVDELVDKHTAGDELPRTLIELLLENTQIKASPARHLVEICAGMEGNETLHVDA